MDTGHEAPSRTGIQNQGLWQYLRRSPYPVQWRRQNKQRTNDTAVRKIAVRLLLLDDPPLCRHFIFDSLGNPLHSTGRQIDPPGAQTLRYVRGTILDSLCTVGSFVKPHVASDMPVALLVLTRAPHLRLIW